MSKYEESVIEFESARNEAIDKFYEARPQLEQEDFPAEVF